MTALLAQLEAAIKLLYPDEMTPTAHRILTNILNESETSTEPSHTGAAPVTSGAFADGDWVRVDDTELPFCGQAGVVRMVGEDEYGDWCTVDFADMASRRLYQASLERTQKPTPLPPRH